MAKRFGKQLMQRRLYMRRSASTALVKNSVSDPTCDRAFGELQPDVRVHVSGKPREEPGERKWGHPLKGSGGPKYDLVDRDSTHFVSLVLFIHVMILARLCI
ncbi:hypothetical protein Scep_004093 [Stephania cephalantha]|uniref:Uncharacterized protein n=1 Tax=Stephania cephalantha TaxID=152367 RepID=A0AAP0KTE4_9MAGN